MDSFKYPWRLEVRASIWHPWRGAFVYTTLDAALAVYRKYPNNVARIRAN